MSPRIATEIALTGEMVGAERLYQAGLLNAHVKPGQALAAAEAMARKIVVNAPMSLAASKCVIVEGRDWPLAEMFDRRSAITGPVLRSRDAREGSAVFTERRLAVWSGE